MVLLHYMKTITQDQFESEVLKSDVPVLLKFFVEQGCGFCDKFAPVFEEFAIKHPEIKCLAMGKATLRTEANNIEKMYDIKSYPATIAILGGKLNDKKTGVLTDEQMIEMTQTLDTMPEIKLMSLKVDFQIQVATKEKELFTAQNVLRDIVNAVERRKAGCNCNKECVTECVSKCEPEDKNCETDCKEFCRFNPKCTHRNNVAH